MPSRYYTASGTDSLKWIRDKPPQFSSDPAYIEVQDGQVFLDIIEGDLPFFGESTHGRSLAQTLFGQPIPSSKPRVIKDSAFHIDYSNRNQADHDHIMAERAHHVASSATSRYEEGAKEISVQSLPVVFNVSHDTAQNLPDVGNSSTENELALMSTNMDTSFSKWAAKKHEGVNAFTNTAMGAPCDMHSFLTTWDRLAWSQGASATLRQNRGDVSPETAKEDEDKTSRYLAEINQKYNLLHLATSSGDASPAHQQEEMRQEESIYLIMDHTDEGRRNAVDLALKSGAINPHEEKHVTRLLQTMAESQKKEIREEE